MRRRFRFLARGLAACLLLALAAASGTSSPLTGSDPSTARAADAAAADGRPYQRPLSLDDRVACQTSLEEVYWRHRAWPADNPGPRPALVDVLPPAAIRARVEDALKQSAALEAYWGRPLTGEQLQAELDRMARDSRQPEVLAELFAALGDDPYLAAECLARPALADRLLHAWFADDARWQGAARARATADLEQYSPATDVSHPEGEFAETEWVRAGTTLSTTEAGVPRVTIEAAEWADRLSHLGQLQEDPEQLYLQTALARTDGTVTVATRSWPKTAYADWWPEAAASLPAAVAEPDRAYQLPLAAAAACTDDTWPAPGALTTPVPSERYQHTAIWTGAEMIVWGGVGPLSVVRTGGRYNPATDTWTPTSLTNAPAARGQPTAIWTGSRMVIWGGTDAAGAGLNTGGRYDPATDSWTPTSLTNAPAARGEHTAVWTGSVIIVWGGRNGTTYFNSGSRYNPNTDSWSATSTDSFIPSPRRGHTAVWTGTEMIVRGGVDSVGQFRADGSRYDPVHNEWKGWISQSGAPDDGALEQSAVWTGTEMLVWGGVDKNGVYLGEGGRYSPPPSNSWTKMPTVGAPSARGQHTAIWTGSELLIWGGTDSTGTGLNDGGRYDPQTNTWSGLATAGAPAGRFGHTAVWTGSEMIVWGGKDANQVLSTGGRYSPSTGSWAPTAAGSSGGSRVYHTAVWTGSEMIVWGGYSGGHLKSGARYTPATATWVPTSAVNAPAGRDHHTAVWTGTEMIVWGGYGDGGHLGSGGRYNPTTDTWTATSPAVGITSRARHTAVWTGTVMVVWGGEGDDEPLPLVGGRYNPATNTWATTATLNAPHGRSEHTAVWTGSEMLIWGGWNGVDVAPTFYTAGGRYNPATNSWAAISTAGVPAGRLKHTAVWTGSQMLIWGGYGGSYLNTGATYTPATDTWAAMSTSGAPSARDWHTAVWTGLDLLVWGGSNGARLGDGGRYRPGTNAWTALATAGAPAARTGHTAVWTGGRMLIWGGEVDASASANSGGQYCLTGAAVINGWVRDDHGNPVAGVTIGTGSTSTTTDATGFYSLLGLAGGSYTLTPSRTGYTFSPPTRTIAVPPDALAQDFTASAVPLTTWYFAEGYTGPGFDEYLTIQNPGSSAAAVTVTYMLDAGSPLVKQYTVPPATRVTRKINDEVGPNQAVSMLVESSQPVTAERPMYFSYGPGGWTGGHDAMGSRPDVRFYFAEGYTGPGFDEYLTLQNPNASSATVTVTYMLGTGSPLVRSYQVPPTARFTVKVNDEVGPNQAVSMLVESTRPVTAERPMYFRYGPQGWTGGHVVVGRSAPSSTWYFAEGTTDPGFDEYLTLQNPNPSAAQATLTYYINTDMPLAPSPITRTVTIPPTARYTVAVHDPTDGAGRFRTVSTRIEASQPIVAERPMYFAYGPEGWTGGHDALGATRPANTWYFAEGYTGTGFDEYLTLFNPGSSLAAVTVRYMLSAGPPLVKTYYLPGTSRRTIKVNIEVGPDQAVSMGIDSSVPVVAERAMYFSYGPGWTGGHVVLGYTPD